jgi:hypothetical protein
MKIAIWHNLQAASGLSTTMLEGWFNGDIP